MIVNKGAEGIHLLSYDNVRKYKRSRLRCNWFASIPRYIYIDKLYKVAYCKLSEVHSKFLASC